MTKVERSLKDFLDLLVEQYEVPAFIKEDPISIPHQYSHKPDIEISGLFAAIFSWGQRVTIISKSNELMALMDHQPHQSILHHSTKDLKRLATFKHRTFQYDDLLYFILFLNQHYRSSPSLESAFLINGGCKDLETSLNYFHQYFFSLDAYLPRTKKHLSHPMNGSTCKRLCMYLRWMVRSNDLGVDFGLWKNISADKLMIPFDVHVQRIALELKLINSEYKNWNTVKLLTSRLAELDPNDPAKYDFALFNLGVTKKAIKVNPI